MPTTGQQYLLIALCLAGNHCLSPQKSIWHQFYSWELLRAPPDSAVCLLTDLTQAPYCGPYCGYRSSQRYFTYLEKKEIKSLFSSCSLFATQKGTHIFLILQALDHQSRRVLGHTWAYLMLCPAVGQITWESKFCSSIFQKVPQKMFTEERSHSSLLRNPWSVWVSFISNICAFIRKLHFPLPFCPTVILSNTKSDTEFWKTSHRLGAFR